MMRPVTPLPSVYDMDRQHLEAILSTEEARNAYAVRICNDGSVRFLTEKEYNELFSKSSK